MFRWWGSTWVWTIWLMALVAIVVVCGIGWAFEVPVPFGVVYQQILDDLTVQHYISVFVGLAALVALLCAFDEALTSSSGDGFWHHFAQKVAIALTGVFCWTIAVYSPLFVCGTAVLYLIACLSAIYIGGYALIFLIFILEIW